MKFEIINSARLSYDSDKINFYLLKEFQGNSFFKDCVKGPPENHFRACFSCLIFPLNLSNFPVSVSLLAFSFLFQAPFLLWTPFFRFFQLTSLIQ